MRQITYISTARPGDGDVMAAIERKAIENNGRQDLSGLLLHDGVRFLQVLEGPESAVAAAFERIKVDPRHFAIVVLRDRIVDERSFGGWAMLCRFTSDADGSLAGLIGSYVADADRSTRALFESFAEIRNAKAA